MGIQGFPGIQDTADSQVNLVIPGSAAQVEEVAQVVFPDIQVRQVIPVFPDHLGIAVFPDPVGIQGSLDTRATADIQGFQL